MSYFLIFQFWFFGAPGPSLLLLIWSTMLWAWSCYPACDNLDISVLWEWWARAPSVPPITSFHVSLPAAPRRLSFSPSFWQPSSRRQNDLAIRQWEVYPFLSSHRRIELYAQLPCGRGGRLWPVVGYVCQNKHPWHWNAISDFQSRPSESWKKPRGLLYMWARRGALISASYLTWNVLGTADGYAKPSVIYKGHPEAPTYP